MESFLKNLQHEVQCSLCNNSLTEPKLLQCFHTFCKPCIQRHAEPKGQVHIFKCPKCSSETLLQELCNVEDLQTSPLHSRMLQVLAFSESDKSCSVSATHSPALWQCFDCDRSLCDECLKNHATFIKDHKVYSFSDLKKEDLESMLKRESPCKSHSDHILEFFCKDCDVLICLLCLRDEDHKNHTISTLQDITAIEKNLISKNLEEIEKLRCNEMEKKKQEEIAVKMKSDGEKAKKEVKKLTKKLVKFLLDQEQELVNQIESCVAKADMNLRIIRHIPAAQQYMKNVLDNGIASDLLNDTTKVDYQPFDKESEGIFFDRDEDRSQQVLNGKLGNVRFASKSKPILSEIQVGSQLMALTKAKLSVLIKISRGEINYDDSDVVDIQISPVDDVKVEEKTVKTGGKIEVEFTPQVPGRLTAEVKLNGIPVSNSPLVMDVKQHIEEIDEDSTLIQALNTGSGEFSGIAVNKANRIAVADDNSSCVRVFSIDGELLLMYDGKDSEKGQLSVPEGVAFLNDTDLVIADANNHRVCIVNTTTGTLVRTFGRHGNGNGEFDWPHGVHVDDDCNIIVSDRNGRVQVFTKDGDYQYQFTVPNQDMCYPFSTVTHNGLFYVSDYNNGVIHVISQMNDGSPTRISTIGEKGDGVGQLQYPYGLAIDNDNNLLVCNYISKVVNKFTLDGCFIGSTSKLNHNLKYIAVLNDGRFICTSDGDSGKVLLFKNNSK